MKDKDSLILQERYIRSRRKLLTELVPYEAGLDPYSIVGQDVPFEQMKSTFKLGDTRAWQYFLTVNKEGVLPDSAESYRTYSPIIGDYYRSGMAARDRGDEEEAEAYFDHANKLTSYAIVKISEKLLEEIEAEGGRIDDSKKELKMRLIPIIENIYIKTKKGKVYLFGRLGSRGDPLQSPPGYIATNIVNALLQAGVIIDLGGSTNRGRGRKKRPSLGLSDVDVNNLYSTDDMENNIDV